MIYYELVEQDIRDRGKIVPVTEIRTHPREFEAYTSLFGYGKEMLDHVRLTGGVADFTGLQHLKTLWFDIDADGNLEGAKESAVKLLSHLAGQYQASPSDFFLYFSGNKGFHIGLDYRLFGGFEPAINLPVQMKRLVINLSASIKFVDNKIYNENRLFRLPNSLNKKSGLYKIPLYLDELLDMSVEAICDMAREPREDFSLEVSRSNLLRNEMLADAWEFARNFDPGGTPGKAPERTYSKFFDPAEKGDRNNTCFRQAAELFDKSELSFDNILQIVYQINLASGEALDYDEVFTVVKSAQKKTVRSQKKKEDDAMSRGPKTFAELIPEFSEYIKPGKKRLSTGFVKFDSDCRKKLHGKLLAIVGKGGSRKSLLAQNIGRLNTLEYNARGIYSSMEMGNIPLMERIINNEFDPEGNENPAFTLEMREKEEPGFVQKVLEETVAKKYSDLLIIDDRGSMRVEDYDSLIEDVSRKHGPVDYLIVDGLSMMGGEGKEVEIYSENTRLLKEVANKWDILVILICHTTKACEPHFRNTMPFIRGSEKILDNMDLVICTSLCVNPYESANANEVEYLPHKGYLYYWNKRGSGKTIKSIYDFNTLQLLISESNENVLDYEQDMRKLGTTRKAEF